MCAAYAKPASDLYLGEEFHWNAIQLVSCRTVSAPLRDFGWDHARIVDVVEQLLVSGKLKTDGVIQPIVPFDRAAEAYQESLEHPVGTVKLGVRVS